MVMIDVMDKADWESVSKILQEGIDSNISTLEKDLPTFEVWDKTKRKDGRFVAKKDGRVVGFIALTDYSYREVYSGVAEVGVYVEADSRGEGIGTQLLNKMIEFADNNNIWTLQSNILEENEASIILHEKCGFRRVGYRNKLGKDKFGLWRNLVLMERRSRKIGFEGCDMSCSMFK